ncbi:MAG: fused MFS/spermidine synthase [Desulfomonile tiedjei]|uniref:Fused MFS/spermidine synthase n=1 Tax=Desulfomonile tiedjei TaxID=2358 RepID=A0A9D6V6P4_9BACT|nr:fused MFS/spermidine synthase [Desulfomonile tiedjei]
MKSRYWVYTLFYASGISGLMYQIVWLRILSRTTGVSIHATATVVAAFMAGLALGSFILGKFVDRRNDPLRIYAVLELCVAATVFLIPYAFQGSVPFYQFLYQWSNENVAVTAVGMGIVSFITLLVPTALMGGTLPVMTTFLVRKDHLLGKNLSILYGINTLGAVTGVVLSSFFLIGFFGERITTYIGIAINLLVAIVAWYVFRKDREAAPYAKKSSDRDLNAATQPMSAYSIGTRRFVLFAFLLSGFTSIAYEVIWTRQLILFLKNSIYAFSAMLAVFLGGVSLGSLAMNRIADRLRNPLTIFGLLEVAIGFISVLNLYLFGPLDHILVGSNIGWLHSSIATVILVFPMTFIFGMILPVAGCCYTPNLDTAGSLVGRLYGFNTVGCIMGSLFAGFLLIPTIGSTKTVILLAALNLVLGLVLLRLEPGRSAISRWAFAPACLILLIPVIAFSGLDPFLSTIENRIREHRSVDGSASPDLKPASVNIFFNKEGIEGTVTAFEKDSRKQLWINGVGMTHLCTETKLMTHLPMMFAKNPKELLVICFGMGTTVKSAAVYPGLQVTAVELVSETFEAFNFYHHDSDALKKPNIRLVANDGRNHLLLSPKKYDVITVDPAPPVWSARTVNLYTMEFFELCKSRLTPDGVICLWLPGASKQDKACLAKTFGTVFPSCSVWSGPIMNYGFYLIGTMKNVTQDELKENMAAAFRNEMIVADLREYDTACDTPEKLLKLMVLDQFHVDAMMQDKLLSFVTDDYPLTEFFLWRDYYTWDSLKW